MNQHLITTLPSRSTCNRCRRPVLCGLDAGMPYTVDLVPLNVLGEVTAQLAERCTYRLQSGYVMYRAFSHMQLATPLPVLAAHSCAPVDPTHIESAHASAIARYLVPHDVADPKALQQLIQPDLFTYESPPF